MLNLVAGIEISTVTFFMKNFFVCTFMLSGLYMTWKNKLTVASNSVICYHLAPVVFI